MTGTSSLLVRWAWPVKLDGYDRTPELKDHEVEVLSANLPCLAGGVLPSIVIERCDVPRLLKPLEDVCTHVELQQRYWTNLKILMLGDMAARGRSYWGWTEQEWIDSIKKGGHEKPSIAAVAYLLCEFDALHKLGRYNFLFYGLSYRIFGRKRIRELFAELEEMLVYWGYRDRTARIYIPRVMCEVLITNRSPHLEDLTLELLQKVQQRRGSKTSGHYLSAISKVLANRKIISAPIMRMERPRHPNPHLMTGVPEKWAQAAKYWFENARHTLRVRKANYYFLLTLGRWLGAEHPAITAPEEWDRNLAAQCLTMITNMRCGDWRAPCVGRRRMHYGRPLTAAGRIQNYTAVRTFFADLQEWGVIPPRFDPYRSLTPPRSVKALVSSSPRIIADDVWAKLLWAGLNVTPEDFASGRNPDGKIYTFYPIEMIRALTLVWLFAGLRGDEIRRLRVGCVRWRQDNVSSVCFLDVPVNKTGTAFTKPVDGVVNQAISAWEKVRRPQAKLCDHKTGEMVDFLFLHRMGPLGEYFLNLGLIPRLCQKAGVPQSDLRGRITSHRARSTIATQLFNAKEPMSLFELQEWLGHRLPSSTQRYAKITPTKLMKSYSDAGYFGRNLRAIEVLIDQEKVRSGVGAQEAWKFYDLGHGYCTYDFFDQCPHRMACAKCSFYLPKESTAAALLEGKSNLLRMRQEIPLSDAELAALDDGVAALESLLSRLANVATPAGQTPVQLRGESLVQIDAAQALD
jgi:integrase